MDLEPLPSPLLPVVQNCEPPAPSEPDPADDTVISEKGRTRNGNIARLPLAERDKLNLMLLDGIPYKEIIAELGEAGKGLKEVHITTWKTDGGFEQWKNEHQFITEWSCKWEFAKAFVDRGHGLNLHQTINQLIATQIHEVMSEKGSDALGKAVEGGDKNVIQLVQAFAALTKSEVECTRVRAEQAANPGGPAGTVSGKKSMKAETRKEIENKLNLR